MLTTAPLRTQSFGVEESVALLAENYLAGESMNLIEVLTDVCSTVRMRTPFEQNLMLADLITVEEFFERGPRKVRRLRERMTVAAPWVEPEEVVDFLAVERLEGGDLIEGIIS